jgi:hypothetical protein
MTSTAESVAAPADSSLAPIVPFDFADPEFQADPYPTYAKLRELEPIAYRENEDGFRNFWLTRHEDVVAVLRDPGYYSPAAPDELRQPGIPEKFRRLGELLDHMMLLRDGIDHARLRSLVNKAFTPRMVQKLVPRIESIADGLIGAACSRGRGEIDVISAIATPLPVFVVAELLGVPTHEQTRFKQWSDEIAVVLDGSVRTAGLPQAADSAAELADFLRGVVAERRRRPQQDLISAMIAARDEKDVLTDDELIANAILILLAGHETTTNLIGNGLYALLQHPEELQRLRRTPSLAEAAVEECLRFDSPVQLTARKPHDDVEFRGTRIPADTEVTLSLGAANRDPAVFEDPERFDVTRFAPPNRPGRILSFGLGSHFCLGAPLARLEGAIALRRLVERLPEFKLAEPTPPRRAGLVLRGLASLPIRF